MNRAQCWRGFAASRDGENLARSRSARSLAAWSLRCDPIRGAAVSRASAKSCVAGLARELGGAEASIVLTVALAGIDASKADLRARRAVFRNRIRRRAGGRVARVGIGAGERRIMRLTRAARGGEKKKTTERAKQRSHANPPLRYACHGTTACLTEPASGVFPFAPMRAFKTVSVAPELASTRASRRPLRAVARPALQGPPGSWGA